ncbi:DUF4910 domain-containing protein [Sinomicrobium weinanense]|uniref:DUF4910 domain-containing protein n=1 Tax=Sinomicrobium weinanense TaxID=2842200 RepID=A0A926Q4C0_9FLAO|nr:DUF4910 domain-containing protein [Sinomicrobium weinanense]MBC9796720.1 DUF4910 domain-containing protein [Sinomicrobium weinanense]MBU3123005.1 DUF4910 domain-containing protein [Sinomicrobium weinanense]
MKKLISFVALTLSGCILFAQKSGVIDKLSSDTGLILNDSITRLLIHHSSGDRAYNYVQQISLWDRQQNTGKYNDAVDWVKQKAQEFRLEDVEVEKYVADGKTSYFGDTPQSFWIAEKGELWSLKPYNYKITSYADLPMSLVRNSYSKKAKAKLIDIGAGTEKDYEDKDLAGKIVLTSNYPSGVVKKAVWEKGAIGIISHYSVPYWDKSNRLQGDFADQVGWAGIPRVEDKAKEYFAFMISERRAEELRESLKKYGEMTLYVDIDTKSQADDFGVVSGVIKGSKYPDEEIVITAHIDHYKPGANDNASGSAVSLEVARTLNNLIRQKKISRPLRTIRFLWVPEFTGTKAWFSRHFKENKKRILNLNLDMLGADLKKTNSFFNISYTPDWNASYINAFSSSIVDFLNKYNNNRYPVRKDFQIISVNGSRNQINASMHSYTRGSDHQIFNDFGIPGVAYSTWPDNYYHSSEDTPDKVDPTQLHRVAFIGLASVIMTAYGDSSNVSDIMNLVEMYGKRRLKNDEFEARKLLLGSSDIQNDLGFSSKIIQYAYKREKEALRSCLLFSGDRSTKKIIEEKIVLYDQEEKLILNDIQALAKNLNGGEDIAPRASSSKEKEAEKIVPVRIKGKELNAFYSTYDILGEEYSGKYEEIEQEIEKVLNILRKREAGELRIYQFEDVIASYSDGRKSVLDIRDALYAEYKIEIPLEVIANIFEVFEKAGVFRFK